MTKRPPMAISVSMLSLALAASSSLAIAEKTTIESGSASTVATRQTTRLRGRGYRVERQYRDKSSGRLLYQQIEHKWGDASGEEHRHFSANGELESERTVERVGGEVTVETHTQLVPQQARPKLKDVVTTLQGDAAAHPLHGPQMLMGQVEHATRYVHHPDGSITRTSLFRLEDGKIRQVSVQAAPKDEFDSPTYGESSFSVERN